LEVNNKIDDKANTAKELYMPAERHPKHKERNRKNNASPTEERSESANRATIAEKREKARENVW